MRFLFEKKILTEIGNKKLKEESLLKDIPKILDQVYPEQFILWFFGGSGQSTWLLK